MFSGHLLSCNLSLLAILKGAGSALEKWPVLKPGMDGAYPDCPCVFFASNQSLDSLSSDRRISGRVQVELRSYGRFCSDHDVGADIDPRCAGEVRPPWCDSKWCYVSATNCERKSGPSILVPGLSLSYTTCGNMDHYLSPVHQPWNSSKPIYAFGIGHEAASEPSTGALQLDKYLRFASVMLPQAGIDLEMIRYRGELSNAAKSKTTNPYSGCLYDLALGHIDLCLGDFWNTAEREGTGAYSFIFVSNDRSFFLKPVQQAEENFWDILAKPFAPFSLDLWALIFAVILAVGVAMFFFEYGQAGGDFEDLSVTSDMNKALTLSINSLLNASSSFTATSLSGRILSCGYGIFILVAISAFTANTASILIARRYDMSMAENIEDALQASANICFYKDMQNMLERAYFELRALGVPIDDFILDAFVARMKSGDCAYSIVGEHEALQSWTSGRNCDFEFAGRSVFAMPTGYFVSDELRSRIAWSVSTVRAQGYWSEIENLYSTQSQCQQRRLQLAQPLSSVSMGEGWLRRLKGATSAASDTGGSDTDALNATHMLGTLLVLVFCFILAGMIRILEILVCHPSAADKQLKMRAEEFVEEVEDSLGLHKNGGDVRRSLHVSKSLSKLGSEAQLVMHNLHVLDEHMGKATAENPELGESVTAILKLVQGINEGMQEFMPKCAGLEEMSEQLAQELANLRAHGSSSCLTVLKEGMAVEALRPHTQHAAQNVCQEKEEDIVGCRTRAPPVQNQNTHHLHRRMAEESEHISQKSALRCWV